MGERSSSSAVPQDRVEGPPVFDGPPGAGGEAGLGGRDRHPPRRRGRIGAILGLALGTLVIGAGIAFLVYRQAARPLQLGLDDNAVGDIMPVNTALSQVGQWYAPYRGPQTSFVMAITFWNNGPWAIRLDKVDLLGFNTSEGTVTFNTRNEFTQSVAPARYRRPLDHTLIAARSDLTVDVPMRYACKPINAKGARETAPTFTDAQVVWELWGEHHTQWMALPQPLLVMGGEACPGYVPPGAG